MKFYIIFLFTVLMMWSCLGFTQSSDYETLMNELCQASNDYSGVLNTRQTWQVSYEVCDITDKYYFDNELTLVVKTKLANIDTVKVEARFVNSIALYPKDDNSEYIEATRYENNKAEKIVDGVYYNLMLVPAMREKAQKMMQEAIEKCRKKA